MKELLKRTAALLTVLVVLMGMVQLPASADQLAKSAASQVITRGISEDPLGPAATELYKGVHYYGWATLKDYDTNELVTYLELTAKAEIINPEGKTVKSLSIDYNESYTDTLLDDFSMNQFYLEFVPDMLGTWTFRVTYLNPDGTEYFPSGSYSVTKECVVPRLDMERWFSPLAMHTDMEMSYAMPGDKAYFNYELFFFENRRIMYENVEGFTIEVELYEPDGTHWTPELEFPYRALNSVEMPELTPGTWSVVVTLKGDVSIRATTQLKVLLPGDVNQDGVVDASDAALVLAEAALLGAGNSGEFTSEQLAVADVNKDGELNAADAAVILTYAAAIGAGSDVTMEDFI